LSINELFILLAVFQLKHFVADFPLQTPYMLNKYRPGWDFIVPLVVHCLVHAIMTLAIAIYYDPQLWWLAVADFAIHFVVDRLKSGPKYFGRYNDIRKPSYWIALGGDQALHHLTSVYIVWVIIKTTGLQA